MRIGWRMGSVLVAALLGGCGGEPEGSEMEPGAGQPDEVAPAPAPSPAGGATGERIERTGRVVASGIEGLQMVNLFGDDGQTVGLTGELLGELTRLSGAVVEVVGAPARTTQSEGVEVADYTVVSIDGETPVVGVLSGGEGAFRLDGAQPVGLAGVPRELASQVGAKVWVTGPETADGRRVQSYGVIRPADAGAR